MGLSDEQKRRLEVLRNRHTLYEAVITRADGTKALLAYCGRKSQAGLIQALCQRRADVERFLAPDGSDVVLQRGIGSVINASNGGRIDFSGRTKRDAIISGNELRYVGDLTSERGSVAA